jgi:predicted transcriptional regulator
MRAYVKVIYSSEGASPAEVERALIDYGFHRMRGSSVYDAEVSDESDLIDRLNRIHGALRGLGVTYAPSQLPEEAARSEVSSYRERLEKWRSMGVDVDALVTVLENDPEEFRRQAKEIMSVQIDRIADERAREAQEQEAKRRLEDARERILHQVGEGGKTFHDLVKAIDMDADVVSDILDDLVGKGRIRAEQQGRKVVFVPL